MTNPDLISAETYGQLVHESGDFRVTYGNDPSQFGDLYLPNSAENRGCVVLLHGGCWRSQYGLDPMGQFARSIANAGVAVWSLEYRRLGNGGGWPHTFLDVGYGIDTLRTLAIEHQLNLDKVVAVGHSAGGHLALWAAARQQIAPESILFFDDTLPINRVVALAPVCDLERAVAWDICVGASAEIVGGHPRQAWQNYYQGSPSALLPLGIPFTVINGDRDDIVPIEYVQPFIQRANDLGDNASLVPAIDVGHFEIVMAAHPAGKLAINTILAQFDDH